MYEHRERVKPWQRCVVEQVYCRSVLTLSMNKAFIRVDRTSSSEVVGNTSPGAMLVVAIGWNYISPSHSVINSSTPPYNIVMASQQQKEIV